MVSRGMYMGGEFSGEEVGKGKNAEAGAESPCHGGGGEVAEFCEGVAIQFIETFEKRPGKVGRTIGRGRYVLTIDVGDGVPIGDGPADDVAVEEAGDLRQDGTCTGAFG